jgi:putative ABC transport system ATP-binding protein
MRQFHIEVTIVLLISFVVIELASITGLSYSVTSSFQYPVNKVLGFLAFTIALTGVYGLLKNNRVGTYFALVASTFWIILGCFSLVELYYVSRLNLALLAHATIALVLGSLTFVFVFRSNIQKNKMNPPLDASYSSDPEASFATGNKYAIETIEVFKKYFLGPNIVSAINCLEMKVCSGEFVAIMGPSGSGKSTLLNLIGALDKPSSGRVLIDGVDISTLDEDGLAKLRNEKIGFVFQAYNLVARSSVLRNMELPALVKGYSKEERLKRVSKLLAIVGLKDKASRKPQTLSGGEQQRVAIARALINDPEIVLADEPTGNVDSKTGKTIIDFLRKLNLNNRTTIVIVTHDPEVASRADRIINLRDGKIVQEKKLEVH